MEADLRAVGWLSFSMRFEGKRVMGLVVKKWDLGLEIGWVKEEERVGEIADVRVYI